MPHKIQAAASSADSHSPSASKQVSPKTAMLQRIAEHCKAFQDVDLKRSLGQVALGLSLYAIAIAAMIYTAVVGQWIVFALVVPFAVGLLVKIFTIQHDCGHGSYFKNRRANDMLGFFLSILTFTPYGFWRDAHNRHHASSGDLSRRGVGAVDTLTVEEYHALSPSNRKIYRLYRHPLMMFFVGAPVYFLLMQRLPIAGAMPFTKSYYGLRVAQIWKSVALLNVALLVFYGGLSVLFGLGAVTAAFLPVVIGAAWIGSWLFFVQHQYEDTYWEERADWDYAEAAIFGSSHYKLPAPLRWFTGNIGLHHIHHLSSRIPNYRLMECYRTSEDLLQLPVMTIRESIKCARLALWDTAQKKMVSFAAAPAAT
jgi:acyl-lipid omega-6 desaturase (Delta-12 desaturase)